MLRRQLGTLTLAVSSVLGLAVPLAAHDYYGVNNRSGCSSEHAREKYERQLRKEQREAQKRWEMEQRIRNRNGYSYGPYYDNRGLNGSYNRSNGYYDRYGNWHQW